MEPIHVVPQPLEALAAKASVEREHAWKAFYSENFSLLYRFAYRCGVPSSEVEDVVQRVFLVAHRRINEGEPIRNPQAWLRGVCLRVVQEHRRWWRVRKVKAWFVQRHQEEERTQADPEDEASCSQNAQKVGALLIEMSPKLRNALVLTDMEGYSPEEASEVLGVPVNTVRSRRRLARDWFREQWRIRFGEEVPGG